MDPAEQTQMDRKHIFAVNGAPDFLDVLRELLQGEDYNVTTTNFVPDTFEQIAALDPDLLIIDLVVGQRAGMDLLARLANEAATREMPIILVSTSRHLLDEVEFGPHLDADVRYLIKPLDLDDLLQAVGDLIGAA